MGQGRDEDVLGNKTFGKGSVQTIIPLSDGSGLRLTTASLKLRSPVVNIVLPRYVLPEITLPLRHALIKAALEPL